MWLAELLQHLWWFPEKKKSQAVKLGFLEECGGAGGN